MKTRYGILLLSALMLYSAAFIPPAHAGGVSATIFIRTDRASYLPGESGTLTITIRNDGSQAFTLNSMEIQWPWRTFVTDHWEGNQTINFTPPQAVASGPTGLYTRDVSFTVPTYGRASGTGTGCSCVTIQTDVGQDSQSFSIAVAVPTNQIGAVGSALPYLEILLQAATVFLLVLVFFGLRRIPK